MRTNDVYSWKTKEKIYQFGSSDLMWLDEDTIIFTYLDDSINNRPYGSGGGYGIRLIDLSNLSEHTILSPTDTKEYQIFSRSNSIIPIHPKQIVVEYRETKNDWSDDPEPQYIALEIDGSTAKRVEGNYISRKEFLKKLGFQDSASLTNVVHNYHNPDWILFEVNEEGSFNKENKVGIANLHNLEETSRIISKGFNSTWNIIKP